VPFSWKGSGGDGSIVTTIKHNGRYLYNSCSSSSNSNSNSSSNGSSSSSIALCLEEEKEEEEEGNVVKDLLCQRAVVD